MKLGDFVLVEPIEEGDKVKAEISHVLLKTHIKQLKKDGKWPKIFDEEEEENKSIIDDNAGDEYASDDSSLNLEELGENPNHVNYDDECSDYESSSSSEDDENSLEEDKLENKKDESNS